MTRLLYIADPMCSWCYGFSSELTTLLAQLPDANLSLVMGGLRAYNTKVMDAAMKQMLRGHWQHVQEASGLPFGEKLFDRDDFIYDTEPACRAVIVVRQHTPDQALNFMHAVQAAFYRDGRDIPQGEILADIAAESSFAREPFLATWNSQEAKAAARQDFAATQRLGVRGFPTLALEHGGELYLVSNGFQRAAALLERIAQIEALPASSTKTSEQQNS